MIRQGLQRINNDPEYLAVQWGRFEVTNATELLRIMPVAWHTDVMNFLAESALKQGYRQSCSAAQKIARNPQHYSFEDGVCYFTTNRTSKRQAWTVESRA